MDVKLRAWEKAGRARMRSPGRPPVGRIDHRRWFWEAIARGDTSVEAAAFAGSQGRSASGGFVRVAGCRRSPWTRRRRGICALPSARTLPCCAPRAKACARSPGRSGARRRRSRGNCAAMPRRAAGAWTTGRRWRSGMPSSAPSARRPPSSRSTTGCVSTWPSVCRARCAGPTARRCPDPSPGHGTGATSLVVRTAGGPARGARSRSRAAWRWTSR